MKYQQLPGLGERKFTPSISIKSFWELLKPSSNPRAICSARTAAPARGCNYSICSQGRAGLLSQHGRLGEALSRAWVAEGSAAHCQLSGLSEGIRGGGDALHPPHVAFLWEIHPKNKQPMAGQRGGDLIPFQRPLEPCLHSMRCQVRVFQLPLR